MVSLACFNQPERDDPIVDEHLSKFDFAELYAATAGPEVSFLIPCKQSLQEQA